MRQRKVVAGIIFLVAAAGVAAMAVFGIGQRGVVAPKAMSRDWPMYMGNVARNSWVEDGRLSAAEAASLRPVWVTETGQPMVAAPAVVNGGVYVGNWNRGTNFFKFDAATGKQVWTADLGYLSGGDKCDPPGAGVSSGAAVVGDTVYVGGGDNWFYALSAVDGSVRWKFNTAFRSDNAYTGNYNWASALVYKGAVYVGVASLADCPLVQGRLLKLDATSGKLLGMFKFVPDGHIGAGVWTSPAIDTATNTVIVTTGNAQSGDDQVLGEALVQLDLDLTKVLGSWRVPAKDRRADTDWGGTPNVFSKGGRSYVATVSKNGKLYIFDVANIAAGPITTTQVSAPSDCPQCGAGNVSSPSYDAGSGQLYVTGPRVRLNGTYYGGTIGAVNPPTYTGFIWRVTTALDPNPPQSNRDICLPERDANCPRTPGVILAPSAGVAGVLAVNTTWETQLRDTSSGELLYSSKVVTQTQDTWRTLYAGSVFAGGRMYLPTTSGQLFAYAPGLTRGDDFAGAKLGEQWYASLAPSQTYQLGDGLQLTAGAQPTMLLQWPLGGDAAAWTVTTTLRSGAGDAGLVAWQDGDNRITLTRVYSDASYIALTSVLSGTTSTTLLADAQPQAAVQLRMSKSVQGDALTSTFTAAYSYDGSRWQEFGVRPAAYFGLLQVGVYVGRGGAKFGVFGISPSN